MIVRILEKLQYEWIFILGFIISLTAVLISKEIIWLIIVFIIGFRIFSLENNLTIGITAILMVLLIISYSLISSESNRIKQYPLNNQDKTVLISVDPMQLNIQNDYLSGQGNAQILDDEYAQSEFLVIFVYYGDDAPLENQTELEQWSVEGTFTTPSQARNFHTFDYREFLANKGIHWQLEITQIQSRYKDNNILTTLSNLRNKVLWNFNSLNEQPWMAFHNKLMLNLDSDFYEVLEEELKEFGILHFFAISGFHLTFIYRYLSYLFRRIGVQTEYIDGLLAILLFGYLFLTHFPVGLVRSYGTIHLRKIAKRYNLPFSQIDILALIALVWIIINPLIILSLGFQLSFLMTYILNIISNDGLRDNNTLFRELVTSLSCLVISWPILIQVSHTWNGAQLLAILLASLIFSRIVMPLVFMTSILFLIPNRIGIALIQPLNFIIQGIQNMIENHSIFYRFTIITGRLNQLEMIILLMGGIAFVYLLNKQSRFKFLIPICLYGSLILVKPYTNIEQTIQLVDVGQGDSMLIQYPLNQGNYLVDTGGRMLWSEDSSGEGRIDHEFAHRNIIPALKALGVRRIDGLIITHMDIDHIGNFSALNREIPIETIYLSRVSLEDPLWASLEFTRGEGRVKIIESDSVTINKQNLSVRQLPRFLASLDNNDKNDQSLVIHGNLGKLEFINTGDLSKGSENEIIRTWPELRADILKLGHHGSNTSTSEQYLKELKPLLAINSAGVNNRYGHPHQDVLDLLEEQGIPYLSTHEKGSIQISYHPWFGYRIRTAIK